MIEQQTVFSLFGQEMDAPLVGAISGAMSLRRPKTQQVFNVRASCDDEAETRRPI